MTPQLHTALHCYAGWNADSHPTRGCSSGGAAYLLARHFLERVHGIVYASVFRPENKTVSVTRICSPEGLEAAKGSKYVRGSFPVETYNLLKADLEEGHPVLFIGTPCQVQGLKNRLQQPASPLICIDLLCHGMPPATYLQDELVHLVGNGPVTDVRFRDGDPSDFHVSIWNNDQCLYSVEARKQPYLLGMLRGVNLMEGCYGCPFARPDRTGDITLGDYIGLGIKAPEGQRASYISVNTPAGAKLYDHFLQDTPGFISTERPKEERLSYRPSILEPTYRSPLRDKFIRLRPRLGPAKAIRRAMRSEILKETPLYKQFHHLAHRIKQLLK